jgi:dipeptidase D
VSIGPQIENAHSPEERVQISSVEKFYKHLLAVLEDLA